MALKSSLLSFRRNCRKTSSRFFTSRGPRTIRADFCGDTKATSQPWEGCVGAPDPRAHRHFGVGLEAPTESPQSCPPGARGPRTTLGEREPTCPHPDGAEYNLSPVPSSHWLGTTEALLLRKDINLCLLYVQTLSYSQSLSH